MINLKICIGCGKKIIINSNCQRRCKKCSQKYRKEYMYKFRRLPHQIKKKKIYDKDYNNTNRKKISKLHKKYYKKNIKYFIEYRKKRKEQMRAYNHNHYLKNKIRRKKYNHHYLKKKKTKYYYKKDIKKIKARQYAHTYNQRKNYCEKCKSKRNLIFHHTNYRLNKGKTLCRKCHLKEHFPLVYKESK